MSMEYATMIHLCALARSLKTKPPLIHLEAVWFLITFQTLHFQAIEALLFNYQVVD
jgi:hypothetical protein